MIDMLSMDWYYKLRAFLEGVEVENIDILLQQGREGDYRALGKCMALRIKEISNMACRRIAQLQILRNYMSDSEWDRFVFDNPEAKNWFNQDGIPIK